MSITQLKRNIGELLEITSDKEVLEMVFNILEDRAKNPGRDILDDLTDEQLEGLDISLEQIKQGKVIPHAEVMKSIRQKVLNAKKRKVV